MWGTPSTFNTKEKHAEFSEQRHEYKSALLISLVIRLPAPRGLLCDIEENPVISHVTRTSCDHSTSPLAHVKPIIDAFPSSCVFRKPLLVHRPLRIPTPAPVRRKCRAVCFRRRAEPSRTRPFEIRSCPFNIVTRGGPGVEARVYL